MSGRLLIIMMLAALLCPAGADYCRAVDSRAEPGPYFVRARYVTVPLRNDLNWFLFKRDQVGMMRYPGKIYYPALDDMQEEEGGNSIYFPPDTSGAPYPAVIFIQGANTSVEQYGWLMEHVASYGYVVIGVTEHMVSSGNMEGQFQNIFPFGVADPTTWLASMTLADIISYLENINESVTDPLPSPVRGLPDRRVVRNPRDPSGGDTTHSLFDRLIDIEKIVLGGHSFGGFLSLMSSNTEITKPSRPGISPKTGFANNVVGWFGYGTHSFSAGGEGYMTAVNVPVLMLVGEKDGVAAGALPNDPDASGYERMQYTFENFIPPSQDGSRHMVAIKGANHLSIATMPDPTVDRSFLDEKEGIISRIVAHQLIREKVIAFMEYYIRGDESALSVLTECEESPYVLEYASK